MGEGYERADGAVESNKLEGGRGVWSGAEDIGFQEVQQLEAVAGEGEPEEKVVFNGVGGPAFGAELVEEAGEEGVVQRRGRWGPGAKAVVAGVLGGASLAGGGTGPGGLVKASGKCCGSD